MMPDTIADNEIGANISEKLQVAVEDANNRCLHGHALDTLEPSLNTHEAKFCVVFGRHPSVKVEPMRVKIPPDTTPVNLSARRYAPMQQAYMDAHITELEELGLVYRNYTSHWASSPRIVPKAFPTDFRMCIDSRAVNALTIPMQWPMPQLDVVITHVAGAKVFFICAWFRGYWQLPFHPDSRECFTFITHRGMYTPTRVPMGAKDAVAYCQSVVEQIFGDLLYNGVLVWLDDILGYAESEEELMELLEEVLQRCEKFGLKLHPGKCKFFLKEVTWCGKVISENGVTHSPERVQGYVNTFKRGGITTVHMCCQLDAVKYSLFARVTSPLYAILEKAMQLQGARTKKRLQKVDLLSVGWGDEEVQSLAQVKAKLLAMVTLAHPKDDWEVPIVTDASLDH
ncbi:LOW QUALITY PROTEIN: Retroelement [Phytophthora megakarya]|uniref:Retroelement n=1 Tax=Phytophthora megakarya TaxID=4795 RepID=A0A225V3H4_9STRA|nr:LOW QUALITY PROTEIN: Retroelement [Phytophthora megakarya]